MIVLNIYVKFLRHIFFGDTEGDRSIRRPLTAEVLLRHPSRWPSVFLICHFSFQHNYLTWLEAKINFLIDWYRTFS